MVPYFTPPSPYLKSVQKEREQRAIKKAEYGITPATTEKKNCANCAFCEMSQSGKVAGCQYHQIQVNKDDNCMAFKKGAIRKTPPKPRRPHYTVYHSGVATYY